MICRAFGSVVVGSYNSKSAIRAVSERQRDLLLPLFLCSLRGPNPPLPVCPVFSGSAITSKTYRQRRLKSLNSHVPIPLSLSEIDALDLAAQGLGERHSTQVAALVDKGIGTREFSCALLFLFSGSAITSKTYRQRRLPFPCSLCSLCVLCGQTFELPGCPDSKCAKKRERTKSRNRKLFNRENERQ